MKTYIINEKDVKHRWVWIDAKGQILGRLAARIAKILMGKGKVTYTPYVPMGDFVVVTNAGEVRVTGNKLKDKVYDHYSGYPGGRKEYTLEELLARKPGEVLMRAVKGMLPKNRLGDRMLKHLRVYAGSEHELQAQQPVLLTPESR